MRIQALVLFGASLALDAPVPVVFAAAAAASVAVTMTRPVHNSLLPEISHTTGDLTVGNDAQGNGGKSFPPNTYAVRPPGAYHGPFKSHGGCTLLEIHYFDPV